MILSINIYYWSTAQRKFHFRIYPENVVVVGHIVFRRFLLYILVHEKKNFVQVSKHLATHKSKNNFVETILYNKRSNIMNNATKSLKNAQFERPI